MKKGAGEKKEKQKGGSVNNVVIDICSHSRSCSVWARSGLSFLIFIPLLFFEMFCRSYSPSSLFITFLFSHDIELHKIEKK